MIDYEIRPDGVAVLRWNLPDHKTNVLSLESIEVFARLARHAIADHDVKGVVVTSAKRDFIAGADLAKILPLGVARNEYKERILGLHRMWREIETGGKPFVAAINGNALGGGFELCLACHRRIAAGNHETKIGLPEVGVGLIPGGGGTQRLPRLIGLRAAVALVMQSRTLGVDEARKAGLVDDVVASEELLEAACRWVLENGAGGAVQPWDRDGFVHAGGSEAEAILSEAQAAMTARTRGLQSAPRHALASMREGCGLSIDDALAVETRHFVACCYDPQTTNILRTNFFGVQAARKIATRPRDVPGAKFDRVGVLGAGMMGAGIAQVTAAAGIDVVMIDETGEKAQQGLRAIRQRLERAVGRGRLSADRVDPILGRITATGNFDALAGAQLTIEAVFEDRQVKAEVTRRAIAVTGEERLFASNTSTLPISGLAEASSRPEGFIGMHFFSPVDQMPLVEIIMGKKTTPQTLAHSLDFLKQIRKTPIVVRDSRGFYTSRVFGTYIYEALEMLEEGVAPDLIEKAGLLTGMPMSPLALSDELSIELAYKVQKQERADLGSAFRENAAFRVCRLMVDKLGRTGRKAGGGYYDYTPEGKKVLWPGLVTHFTRNPDQPETDDLVERFLSIQAVEALRCLDEGVLLRAIDGDVGAVLGWGFPAYRGGPIAYADTVGVKQFVTRCDQLAQRHGERFIAPELARRMAARGERFYSDDPTNF